MDPCLRNRTQGESKLRGLKGLGLGLLWAGPCMRKSYASRCHVNKKKKEKKGIAREQGWNHIRA